ncbi:MAG: HD domain-containing protein [Candidatus Obscuribacter sp.]|nr:HD domain-containing protein [Candidatus Obscuribacter sp.]
MEQTLSHEAMVDVVRSLATDPALLKLYAQGDKLSRGQTKHNVGHAVSVVEVADKLAAEVSSRFPEKLPPLSVDVIIPAGAFFHDIGRALNVSDHAEAGRKVALEFLRSRGFSLEVAGKVAAIVSRHRSEDFLKISQATLSEFPELCIVVIADKCVGDEDRVRFWRAMALRVLSKLGLARRNLWRNAKHDRVNFSIKNSEMLVDSDPDYNEAHAGAMILQLQVDESIASARELVTLYTRRFQACDAGARSMGFIFRLEINGIRYRFDESHPTVSWSAIETFSIQPPQ